MTYSGVRSMSGEVLVAVDQPGEVSRTRAALGGGD